MLRDAFKQLTRRRARPTAPVSFLTLISSPSTRWTSPRAVDQSHSQASPQIARLRIPGRRRPWRWSFPCCQCCIGCLHGTRVSLCSTYTIQAQAESGHESMGTAIEACGRTTLTSLCSRYDLPGGANAGREASSVVQHPQGAKRAQLTDDMLSRTSCVSMHRRFAILCARI